MRPHNGPRPSGPRAQVKAQAAWLGGCGENETWPADTGREGWAGVLRPQGERPGLSSCRLLAGLLWLLSGCLVYTELSALTFWVTPGMHGLHLQMV